MKLFRYEKTPTQIVIRILWFRINIMLKLTQKEVLSMLNNFVDITKCPKAKGKLRALQLADLELLKLFHDICQKHNIEYMLQFGTLIGAVRHKGYIPWDDDLDLIVFSTSYEKLLNILEEELKETDLTIYGIEKTRLGNDFLRISHKNFPSLNLDISYIHPSELHYEQKNKIKKIWDYHHFKYYCLFRFFVKFFENRNLLKKFRKEINSHFEKEIVACDIDNANIFVDLVADVFFVLKKEWVYPLKLMQFENYQFYVPNNPDKVLREFYGDYMSFPKSLVHHGSIFSNFDEDEIIEVTEYLKKLDKKILNLT